MNHRAVLLALLSAALFGASTPAAKALLGTMQPAMLAGLLYCGAGAGVAIVRHLFRPMLGSESAVETPLQPQDFPWLAGAVVAGGIAGPILLMLGLARTEAATASLLLTLEGAATALLAWFAFHENVNRRVVLGMACLVAGTAILAWSGAPTLTSLIGPALIIGACVAWGLDNNLTRKISLSDPLQIVEIKGLVAGPVNLALGFWLGASVPAAGPLAAAAFVGFLGYGVSLALFVLALRDLGTARTAAYYSTAPFLGAVVAVIVLREPVTAQLVIAGALMAFGVFLHITEKHRHLHEHQPVEHAHPHVHDDHHRHAHAASDPPGEPHTHAHRHEWMRHEHAHMPDMHHTHRHR